MSTELYRKYIDIINENSQPINQLDEGKLARALAILGLSGLGIMGQHQAMMPSDSELANSAQVERQVQIQLAKDPEYAKTLANFMKGIETRTSSTASDWDKSSYDRSRMGAMQDTLTSKEDSAKKAALQIVKDQQPTIYNAIKNAVTK